MSWPLDRKVVEKAYIKACSAEVRALKPGNVHIHAEGHGMQVADFDRSAEVSAPFIADPDLSVGKRIRRAVDVTWEAVACNTNLGIVLLCAPLAAAAQSRLKTQSFADRLKAVLDALDVSDAENTFRAIARANPAGLGRAAEGDVAGPAAITLKEAMALAAMRDRIARAYATGFEDIVGFGLTAYRAARGAGATLEGAVTTLHMTFLAAFPDSHIARKHGMEKALAVQALARESAALWQPFADEGSRADLMRLDNRLKSDGLNPGTTADLVVATLFADTLFAQASGRSRDNA